MKAGHCVFGLDSSAGMLAHLQLNLPGVSIVRADARRCPLADASFDAAIPWGMMFHLSRNDQSATLASVSRVLKPGAPFLFTAAEIADAGDGGVTGTMNGVTFPYYAVPSYRTLIAERGLLIVNVHDDPGVSTYFLVRKPL